jgi:hypothetical protein
MEPINKFGRWLAAAGALLCISFAAPTQAASFTFSDPNCAAFGLTGGGGAYTITCQSLACSISGNTNPSPLNAQTTLTASCNPSASTYAWTEVSGNAGCPAPSTPSAASITQTGNGNPLTCVYQVAATGGALQGTATAQVTWTNAPPPPPSGCSVVANPTSVPQTGGTVNLTASCTTNNGSVTSWTWTKNGGAMAGTTSSNSETLGANGLSSAINITYGATANYSGGSVGASSANVSEAGTGGGSIQCSGFTNTRVLTLNWPPVGTTQVQDTSNHAGGTFGNNDALVIQFTVPASGGGAGQYGYLSANEFNGPSTQRVAVLSSQACDFNVSSPTLGTGAVFNGVTNPLAYYVVNAAGGSWYAGLQNGVTYYFNIKNRNAAGSQTCGASNGDCAMKAVLSKPSGM